MKDEMMIGIIGGTGLYNIGWLGLGESRIIGTPFGETTSPLYFGKVGEHSVIFLPRHGESHQLLPSEVNYRANIWALKSVGVERIISFSATGSLKAHIKPGDLAIPSQYFDFVKDGRKKSFFGDGLVGHITSAEPVCPNLRSQIYSSAIALDLTVHKDLTYGCVDGPRLGTRAESFFLRDAAKCDLVGMTNVPEVFLAREAQVCYSTISIPTDYDCWMDEPELHVTVPQLLKRYSESIDDALLLLRHILEMLSSDWDCSCRVSLAESLMFDPEQLDGRHKIIMDTLLK